MSEITTVHDLVAELRKVEARLQKTVPGASEALGQVLDRYKVPKK